MAIETTPFDPAEYLDDDDAMAAYLDEALATGDPAFVADALGVIARARGMSDLARKTSLSRENLYRTLRAEGNPEFSTIIRVVRALGMNLSASMANTSEKKKRVARTPQLRSLRFPRLVVAKGKLRRRRALSPAKGNPESADATSEKGQAADPNSLKRAPQPHE